MRCMIGASRTWDFRGSSLGLVFKKWDVLAPIMKFVWLVAGIDIEP